MSNRGLSAPCFLYVTKEAYKGGRGGHGHPRTPPLSLHHRRGGGLRDKSWGITVLQTSKEICISLPFTSPSCM